MKLQISIVFFIVLFFGNSVAVFGTEDNSKFNYVLSENQKVENLIRKDLDSAFTLVNLLYERVESHDSKEKIVVLITYGEILEKQSNYSDAILMFNNALSISEKLGLRYYEIESLSKLGHVYSLLENMVIAFNYFTLASELAIEINDVEQIAKTDLQLGEYYRRNSNFKSALNYLNRAKKVIEQNKLSKKLEISVLNRFAAVWTEMDINYDSIIDYSERALQLAISINDLHNQALSYNELGARSERYTIEQRIEFYTKAINIWAELGYKRYEALPTIHLINIECIPQKKYEKAIKLIQPLLKYLPDNTWEKDVLFQQLSGSYEALGDYKKALEVDRERFRTYSNVQSTALNKQIEELTLKHEADKTQKELDSKSLALLEEKNAKQFYFLVIIALIVIFSIIFSFLYLIFKKNKRLSAQQKEILHRSNQLKDLLSDKEVLLKEVNHRVKNNMIMVSSILEMQQEATNDEKVKACLQVGVDRVRSLSYAHQQLYETEDYTDIELNKYIQLIIENFSLENEKVNIQLEFDQVYRLPIEKAQAIGFVINELVTNSFKHAWPYNSDDILCEIEVRIEQKEEFLIFNYRDNGIGYDKTQNPDNLGMLLIHSFVNRQLSGSIEFKNEKGTQIIFTCKVN